MHDIALAVLASGGHGQKKIIYGVLLLIVIVLVIGWVVAAKKARNRS